MVKYVLMLVLVVALLSSGCSTIHGIILRSPSDGRYYVKPEESNWGVKLPDYPFQLLSKRSIANENGRGLYLHLALPASNNLNLSLWIGPITKECSSATECVQKKLMSGKDISVQHSSNKKAYSFDKFAIAEYFLPYWPEGYPPIKGVNAGDRIDQLNINAFYVRGSFWLDIHISQVGVNPDNIGAVEDSFKSILRQVEIWKPR